jgi:hypothetical protein
MNLLSRVMRHCIARLLGWGPLKHVALSSSEMNMTFSSVVAAGPWEQERQQERRRRVRVGGTDDEMDKEDEALDVRCVRSAYD